MIRALSSFGLSGLVASSFLLGGCSTPPSTNNGNDGGTTVTDGGPPSGDVVERGALDKLAESMRSFHKDTTGWPLGDSVWRAVVTDEGADPQVDPAQFTENDKALFQQAKLLGEPLPACEEGKTDPCWSGPYALGATNMTEMLDKWGHKRFFAFIRPFDGNGGGTIHAEDGAIVIWSSGPDGLDQTGCQTLEDLGAAPGCEVDYAKLAAGQPSVDGADDIVVLVANSAK